jgi:hypothetical protein
VKTSATPATDRRVCQPPGTRLAVGDRHGVDRGGGGFRDHDSRAVQRTRRCGRLEEVPVAAAEDAERKLADEDADEDALQ